MNLYNKIKNWRFKMKMFFVLFVGLLTFAVMQFTGSTSTPAAEVPTSTPDLETEVFSTFFCPYEDTDTEAVTYATAVRDAYDQGGDEAAFKEAEKLVASGICEFTEYGIRFWNDTKPPEELKAFGAVRCEALSNGHCLAVQPSFIRDDEEKMITGISIVEPLVPQGSETPQPTEAHRASRGIIFNLN
jgi:hypothetical protein